MSSNLHRNSTEANKHTPKGFDLAVNNSRLIRDERGQSRYIDNLLNERAENLVDGNSAPPTTTEGHVYVLIDEGSGSVHVDWQGADYNDVVRVQGGVWGVITPTAGYFIFNKTDGKYYKFNGSIWEEFGGSVVWGNITGTLSDQTDLQTALDDKQDTLVSGTNIKTINGESLLGSTDISINSQNLGTNDLTQVDATRTYEMGTSNRILRFLSNAVEKIIFNTASGSPTLQANKSGNGPAIRANKTSGSGSAFEVAGGTSDFGNNKLINVEDPTNSQDASTKAYADTKNINAYDDTDVSPLTRRTKYRAVEYIEFEDDAVNSETKIQLRADSIKDAEGTRFGENGAGNVDLKIQENKILTGNSSDFAIEYTASAECVIGLNADSEILEFETIEIYNILKEESVNANKTLALLDINGNSANVKAKFEISAIAVQNTTANAVTLNIGSTALGTDVVNAFVLGASETKKLPLGTTFFSTTTGQNLFISSALWNSANINIHVTISKIWQ